MVRMLHTSDVHIGHVKGPGEHHADVCQCPALGLAAAVLEHQADVLMISGDLFDHARLSDITVGATLEIVASPGRLVVIIPGNHDVHDTKSLWEDVALMQRTGVHLRPSRRILFVWESKGMTFWGRAIDHEPGYRPLREVPARPNEYYVVAAHGHLNLSKEEPTARRQSLIEISATEADYVALGHWHVPTDASHGE